MRMLALSPTGRRPSGVGARCVDSAAARPVWTYRAAANDASVVEKRWFVRCASPRRAAGLGSSVGQLPLEPVPAAAEGESKRPTRARHSSARSVESKRRICEARSVVGGPSVRGFLPVQTLGGKTYGAALAGTAFVWDFCLPMQKW